ncbi:double-stranded RNA-specific editase 1-like protein, partial [Dinothrombium tinctorium]
YSLGKSGKPREAEWTTLAAVVIEEDNRFYVACLATGTKCTTGERSKLQNVIIDCHAESLCKRAFKKFLCHHFLNGHSVDGLKFHLFISQLPCGVIERYRGAVDKDNEQIGIQRKPGKGEKCEKASCVDKIAKWNILGFQGRRLLAITKKPIKFDSIVIGNCTEKPEYNGKRFRACLTIDKYQIDPNQNKIIKSEITNMFPLNYCPSLHFNENFRESIFTRRESVNASNSAIVFWKENGSTNMVDVVVNGFKQGVTRKEVTKKLLRISKQTLTSDIDRLFDVKKDHDL